MTEQFLRYVPQMRVEEDCEWSYYKSVAEFPLLGKYEEIFYAKKIEGGNQALALLTLEAPLTDEEKTASELKVLEANNSRKTMIECNLRLVLKIALRHLGKGLPLSDMIQEGNIGLMKAVEKFEYRKGNKFSTCAVPWISQRITRAIAKQGRSVRLPDHQHKALNRLARADNELSQILGRTPTIQEFAQSLEMKPSEIQQLIRMSLTPISLNSPIEKDGGVNDDTLIDTLVDETSINPSEAAENTELSRLIDSIMDTLPTASQRRVLKRRFGFDGNGYKTLKEVGQENGVTSESTRQLVAKGLSAFRKPAHIGRLKHYL